MTSDAARALTAGKARIIMKFMECWKSRNGTKVRNGSEFIS